MIKYLRIAGVLALCAALLGGCASEGKDSSDDKSAPEASVNHYVITRYFSDDEGVQEFIETQKAEDTCTDIFLNDDGYIEVVANNDQRDYWLARSQEVIDNVIAESSLDDEGYELRLNEAANVLMIDGTKGLKIDQLAADTELLLQNAEFYQVMSGTADWSVKVILYNHDTGSDIAHIDFPAEDLNVDSDMWE